MPFRDINFFSVQIRTGLTWSRVAASSKNRARIDRSREKARNAYENALFFLPRANLKQQEAERVKSELAFLRSELQRLGEKV
jgi:hypothetical protein